jgi:hypothetical protein
MFLYLSFYIIPIGICDFEMSIYGNGRAGELTERKLRQFVCFNVIITKHTESLLTVIGLLIEYKRRSLHIQFAFFKQESDGKTNHSPERSL